MTETPKSDLPVNFRVRGLVALEMRKLTDEGVESDASLIALLADEIDRQQDKIDALQEQVDELRKQVGGINNDMFLYARGKRDE